MTFELKIRRVGNSLGVIIPTEALAHGIVSNHPFVDGNTRSGFLAAAVFLEANGFRLEATEESALLMTIQLAAGEITAADSSAWLGATAVPVTDC